MSSDVGNAVPVRPNLKSLFEEGSASLKSDKFRRAAGALSWRQKYLNSDVYSLHLNSRTLHLRQVKNGEMTGVGTGCSVWPAAHVLTKYLEKRYGANGMCGMRVCDIGSGTGCTGIAAACLGAQATLTDQLCVFPLLQSNVTAALSQCGLAEDLLVIAEYNWGEGIGHLGAPFDLVLVSDCVLPKLYPIEPLVQAVSAVMGPASVALFSYEHRPFPDYDPRQEFRRLAHKYSLEVRTIPLAEHDAVYSMDDIELWEVRRLGAGERDPLWEQTIRKGGALRMMSWGDKSVVHARLFNELELPISQSTDGTIGCVLWPSSVILSRFLLARLDQGKTGSAPKLAVDLGAGCGLTTIALSLSGYTTISIDKASVTPLLSENLLSARRLLCSHTGLRPWGEGGGVEAEVLEMDWYATDAAARILARLGGRVPDLVVCSDCLYQSATVLPLLNILSTISGAETELLIANELRSSFDEFIMLLKEKWTVQDTALTSQDLEVCSSSAEAKGDPQFARFERPVRLLSAASTKN